MINYTRHCTIIDTLTCHNNRFIMPSSDNTVHPMFVHQLFSLFRRKSSELKGSKCGIFWSFPDISTECTGLYIVGSDVLCGFTLQCWFGFVSCSLCRCLSSKTRHSIFINFDLFETIKFAFCTWKCFFFL